MIGAAWLVRLIGAVVVVVLPPIGLPPLFLLPAAPTAACAAAWRRVRAS